MPLKLALCFHQRLSCRRTQRTPCPSRVVHLICLCQIDLTTFLESNFFTFSFSLQIRCQQRDGKSRGYFCLSSQCSAKKRPSRSCCIWGLLPFIHQPSLQSPAFKAAATGNTKSAIGTALSKVHPRLLFLSKRRFSKSVQRALTSAAQLVGHHPARQRVPGSISHSGHIPGLQVQSLAGAYLRGN